MRSLVPEPPKLHIFGCAVYPVPIDSEEICLARPGEAGLGNPADSPLRNAQPPASVDG